MPSLFAGLFIGALVVLLSACGGADHEPQAEPTPPVRLQKPFPVDPAPEEAPNLETTKG